MQPLTGTELKEFTTSLLDGDEMDDTPFYTMINIVKTFVESRRTWRVLLNTDSSQTAYSSDTYTTTKPLPERFLLPDEHDPMQLVAIDNTDEVLEYKNSEFSRKEYNKNKSALFYIDVANEAFCLISSIEKDYRIHLNYIKESEEITADSTWKFPARYHPLLAYMVSGMQKGGVDYDDIFARMAPENRSQASLLMNAAESWDDSLQRSEYDY